MKAYLVLFALLPFACLAPSQSELQRRAAEDEAKKKLVVKKLPGGACAMPQALGIAPAADADIAFEVHPSEVVGKISPDIYGTNGGYDLDKNRQTVVRMGGNRLTAYNWENNASNAGSDWKFQNDDNMGTSEDPAASVIRGLKPALDRGAAVIATVPIVDYVAADKRGGGDVRNSGPDYLKSRFRQNKSKKGSAFAASPDKNDGFVYEDEFVAFLRHALPKGRILFSLDNEPDLWSHTHAEVHPDPVSYEELARRNLEYAAAIKDVLPDAEVLGFVSYGYNGFTSLQNAPDSKRYGDFIEFYLQAIKAGETQAGKRLIDYLDLHWYPEARGGGARITESKKSDETIEARLQAPRSLWDPEYKEESWISENEGVIRLIPRLKAKVENGYPGTKIAFTEWNYGGTNDISGALAAADVFGVFGCTGVSLATEWALGGDEPYFRAALRAFRNFDGRGAKFGDTAVFAETSDRAGASIYASTDSSGGGRLVVLLLNKLAEPQRAALSIGGENAGSYKLMQAFRLDEDDAEVRALDVKDEDEKMSASKLELPERSLTLLVLKR